MGVRIGRGRPHEGSTGPHPDRAREVAFGLIVPILVMAAVLVLFFGLLGAL